MKFDLHKLAVLWSQYSTLARVDKLYHRTTNKPLTNEERDALIYDMQQDVISALQEEVITEGLADEEVTMIFISDNLLVINGNILLDTHNTIIH